MKFVRKKGSYKEGFLERLLHSIISAYPQEDGSVLALFSLTWDSNLGKGWVAKVDPETKKLEYLTNSGWYGWGGWYIVKSGDVILEKESTSSGKYRGAIYRLYKFSREGWPIMIGRIDIDLKDRELTFSDPVLEKIYKSIPPTGAKRLSLEEERKAVQALISFYESLTPEQIEKMPVAFALR